MLICIFYLQQIDFFFSSHKVPSPTPSLKVKTLLKNKIILLLHLWSRVSAQVSQDMDGNYASIPHVKALWQSFASNANAIAYFEYSLFCEFPPNKLVMSQM